MERQVPEAVGDGGSSYSINGTAGVTQTMFIRAVNNASVQLSVVGGIVTVYQLQ